ncbi:hypothetical protein THPR109532_19265 [Thalassospira profundimaris]
MAETARWLGSREPAPEYVEGVRPIVERDGGILIY